MLDPRTIAARNTLVALLQRNGRPKAISALPTLAQTVTKKARRRTTEHRTKTCSRSWNVPNRRVPLRRIMRPRLANKKSVDLKTAFCLRGAHQRTRVKIEDFDKRMKIPEERDTGIVARRQHVMICENCNAVIVLLCPDKLSNSTPSLRLTTCPVRASPPVANQRPSSLKASEPLQSGRSTATSRRPDARPSHVGQARHSP